MEGRGRPEGGSGVCAQGSRTGEANVVTHGHAGHSNHQVLDAHERHACMMALRWAAGRGGLPQGGFATPGSNKQQAAWMDVGEQHCHHVQAEARPPACIPVHA